MKVVIKRPNEALEVIEVGGLKEINKIVGNLDENGEGVFNINSDIRQEIFKSIDIYVNETAIFNTNLPNNFWDKNGNNMYCGNAIFAGFDENKKEEFGLCSLTDEQIDYLKKNICTMYDI